jgi:hypothetical protein
MPSNHKLTGVIKGRTIVGAAPSSDDASTYLLQFDDGSKMKIKVAEAPPTLPAPLNSPIKAVRQNEVILCLDLENGASLAFPLAEATSSVLLRDKNGGFEYAD